MNVVDLTYEASQTETFAENQSILTQVLTPELGNILVVPLNPDPPATTATSFYVEPPADPEGASRLTRSLLPTFPYDPAQRAIAWLNTHPAGYYVMITVAGIYLTSKEEGDNSAGVAPNPALTAADAAIDRYMVGVTVDITGGLLRVTLDRYNRPGIGPGFGPIGEKISTVFAPGPIGNGEFERADVHVGMLPEIALRRGYRPYLYSHVSDF